MKKVFAVIETNVLVSALLTKNPDSQDGSLLVTGNLKHFPNTPIVVSPRELLDILEKLQIDKKF